MWIIEHILWKQTTKAFTYISFRIFFFLKYVKMNVTH